MPSSLANRYIYRMIHDQDEALKESIFYRDEGRLFSGRLSVASKDVTSASYLSYLLIQNVCMLVYLL